MDEHPTRRAARAAESEAPIEPSESEGTGRRPRGPVASVFHAIGVGLSAGLLLLMLGLAVVVVVLPIASGGTAYTVLTGSMRPHLPPGTFIVVRPTPVENIHVGDIVTYQLESGRPEVVTHRVIQRTIDPTTGDITFITKGDANNEPDAKPVQAVQVRGTVWYAIPYLGWVNNVINGESRAWLVPIIAGLLLAYAAWMVVGGLRDRRKAQREKAAELAPDGPAPDDGA